MFAVVLVFTSCESITENEPKKEQESVNLEKNIAPLALEYLVKYVYYWELEKYTPVSNKKLGIWLPHDPYLYSIAKNKFGFNSLLVFDGWTQQTAINVGYDSLQLVGMIPHNKDWYQYFINMYKTVGSYYIDEPFERGEYNISELSAVLNFIRTNAVNNNASVLIGSYHDEFMYSQFYSQVLSLDANTFMMDDKYQEDIEGIVLWTDQRSHWTSFKNVYSNRNKSNWIDIDLDYNEYNDLLGHANNLGLNEKWLYANSATLIEDHLYAFSDNAWKTNWMLKIERRYSQEFRCYERDCEPDENWQLYETVPLNQFRTLSYNQDQE